MALATPRTWVVGEVVTAAELNAEVRDQWNDMLAAWVTYSPTWAGLSVLGSSTANGRYKKVGRTVTGTAELTWGTSSSLGTGTITVTLPATAATVAGNLGWQTIGRYYDGAGSTWKTLIAYIASAGTTATVYAIRQSDVGWVSPGTAGYAWASGSTMRVEFDYESAS
jgi:hypothetical protein